VAIAGVLGAVLAAVLVGLGVYVLRWSASTDGVDMRPARFNIWLSWAHLTPRAIQLRGVAFVLFGGFVAALTLTMLIAPSLLGVVFVAFTVCWLGTMAAFLWEYLGRD
jgi:hypothetical protein